MERIEKPLKKLFEKHRIVFWYDSKNELRDKYDELELAGVQKLEIQNNEFQLKYKVLREEKDSKFLLYHEGPKPENVKNWLLDVVLSHCEFRTDQVSIWLNEIGLSPESMEVMEEHKDFFNSSKRRELLKDKRGENDTKTKTRLKMMAICCNAETRIDSILESLFGELSEGKNERFSLLKKTGLEGLFWQKISETHGYQSDNPDLEDLAIELFKSSYNVATGLAGSLNAESLVFLNRWKDSRKHQEAFESLSNKYSDILNIEQDLQIRDYQSLIEIDYFSIIDQKILSELAKEVVSQTLTPGKCSVIVRQRRQTHWYPKTQFIYEAVDTASQFIKELSNSDFTVTSMSDGIEKYVKVWYKIDQLYRKYIYSAAKAANPPVLKSLSDKIENSYTNDFLLPLNNLWQTQVDAQENWEAASVPSQQTFFKKWVSTYLDKDKKIVVIISDALRYEAGEELVGRIRQEDRYEASIDPILSSLPSYTQLGMAALLPHKAVSITDDAKILIDNLNTQGTASREKILLEKVKSSALAIKDEQLMNMPRDEAREVFKSNNVIYIYHNKIDKIGDDVMSEGKTCEAVESAELELITIIKKLTAANATNIIVTADHGFIYQNKPLEESDFSGESVEGDNIVQQGRRYIVGKDLVETPGLKKFTANQVGLEGALEIQIPKSINRLRLKGSGSRFVHGGASLQEVVVPVIQINKKRTSDISTVEINILSSTTQVITSSQLAVAFYQTEPVSDKVRPRKLVVGLYSQSDDLISDKHELSFDLESENPREREIPIRFLLSRAADNLNNQEVYLKLKEKVGNTNQYTDYQSARYQLRRSFTSDFDF